MRMTKRSALPNLPNVIAWNTTPAEEALRLPCDDVVSKPNQALWRAVGVNAPAALVFRWLCQLRAAPYSYDWIDNLGRRSPQQLTPGLEHLALGQRMMFAFKIVSFTPDEQVTIRPIGLPGTGSFATAAMTYACLPVTPTQTRLLGKITLRYPNNLLGAATAAVLPLGDLIMMRRQLLNFKHLAERDPQIDTDGHR